MESSNRLDSTTRVGGKEEDVPFACENQQVQSTDHHMVGDAPLPHPTFESARPNLNLLKTLNRYEGSDYEDVVDYTDSDEHEVGSSDLK